MWFLMKDVTTVNALKTYMRLARVRHRESNGPASPKKIDKTG
jgi:hypothetical protein